MEGESQQLPEELHQAVQKLGRANLHLKTIKDEFKRFSEAGSHGVVAYEETKWKDESLITYRVERMEPVPEDWSLVIGDFLYNVRAVLDYAALALVARKSRTPTMVGFPVFKNRSRFWRRNAAGRFQQRSGGWALAHFPADARQHVVDLQPYKRGNSAVHHPLWLLHTLSNYDKHQALHIARSALTKHEIHELTLYDAKVVSFDVRSQPLDGPDEIGWLRVRSTGADPHLYSHLNFYFEPAFAEGGPAAGRAIYPLLIEIWNFVLEEVFNQRFLPYFRAREA